MIKNNKNNNDNYYYKHKIKIKKHCQIIKIHLKLEKSLRQRTGNTFPKKLKENQNILFV